MSKKQVTLYEKFLRASKASVAALKRPLQVKKAKNDLEREILDLESKVSELDLELIEAKKEYPINFKTILSKQNKLELAQRELEVANNLFEELFVTKVTLDIEEDEEDEN